MLYRLQFSHKETNVIHPSKVHPIGEQVSALTLEQQTHNSFCICLFWPLDCISKKMSCNEAFCTDYSANNSQKALESQKGNQQFWVVTVGGKEDCMVSGPTLCPPKVVGYNLETMHFARLFRSHTWET